MSKGKIEKIKNNQLIGGTDNTDLYPITSTKAVFDENDVSQDYLNKHITGDRIENNTISGDKLEDKALTEEKIADKAVTKDKIAAKQIGWQKLDDDLQNIIVSKEEGGVALSNEFGDSELIGITQKKLSEAHDDLQSQIDTIISDKATISLSASTSTFIVGERSFTLTASTNINAENIVIKQGDNLIATGSGKTIAQTITVTQATASSITYTAEFTFAGENKRSTTATVYFVNKLYVGSGAAYTDVIGDSYAQGARRSPAGTYNVTVVENAQYVFFVIPATMSISKATLSGFNFPLDAPVTKTIDDVSYKVYRSSNTNDAGTYQIVIS